MRLGWVHQLYTFLEILSYHFIHKEIGHPVRWIKHALAITGHYETWWAANSTRLSWLSIFGWEALDMLTKIYLVFFCIQNRNNLWNGVKILKIYLLNENTKSYKPYKTITFMGWWSWIEIMFRTHLVTQSCFSCLLPILPIWFNLNSSTDKYWHPLQNVGRNY